MQDLEWVEWVYAKQVGSAAVGFRSGTAPASLRERRN
jgi:hypothetical protein